MPISAVGGVKMKDLQPVPLMTPTPKIGANTHHHMIYFNINYHQNEKKQEEGKKDNKMLRITLVHACPLVL